MEFNLKPPNAYAWCNIFIVLSWHRFDNHLESIKFPLTEDVTTIRPIAKQAISDFLESDQIIYQHGIVPERQQYFDRIYEILMEKLREEKMAVFVKWGNMLCQLSNDHDLNVTLLHVSGRRSILDSIAKDNTITSLSPQRRKWIHDLIEQQVRSDRKLDAQLDQIDQDVQSDLWASRVYSQYHKDYYRDGSHPPELTTSLWSWIQLFSDCAFIQKITTSLSSDEFSSLNDLIRTHPQWIACLERSQNSVYSRLLDLRELQQRLLAIFGTTDI